MSATREYAAERIKSFLEGRLKGAFDAAAEREHTIPEVIEYDNDEYAFSIRREVVRQFKKGIRQGFDEFFDSFDREYKLELRRDDDVFPTAWMTRDRKLWSVIGSRKSIFVPLLNHLWKSRLSIEDSKRISSRINAGKAAMATRKGGQVSRYYVIIQRVDYEDLAKKLNASKSTIYNYIEAFVKLGILAKLRKYGPRGHMVYAMGYFLAFKSGKTSGYKSMPFVNETMKPALREFNVYG